MTGDEGTGDHAAYHDGGHDEATASGDTPAPTGDHEDAPGADAGAGSGKMDPERAGSAGPRS